MPARTVNQFQKGSSTRAETNIAPRGTIRAPSQRSQYVRKNGSTLWMTATVVQVKRKITAAKRNGRLCRKERTTTITVGTRNPA